MNPPNFYRVVCKWMFRQIFESLSNNKKTLLQDAKANQLSLTWRFMKQNNLWFAAIVDDLREFIAVEVADVIPDIISKHAYQIVTSFNSPDSPSIHEEVVAEFSYIIQDDETGDEEEVNESTNAFLNFWFDKSGRLRMIDIEEAIAGEHREVWPENEYELDEPIYIDKDTAEAEGLS